MTFDFINIPTGSQVTFLLSNNSAQMTMEATIDELLREDLAVITLHTNVTQTLNFSNVHIDMMYTSPEGLPYQWSGVQIAYLKNRYLLKTNGIGHRLNRRSAFRVGVSRPGQLRIESGQILPVVIRDISLTGFSITDTSKKLPLKGGSTGTLIFEDIGHELDLFGSVIRVEERDNAIIYGFLIKRSCKDLASYVTAKQRRNRNSTR